MKHSKLVQMRCNKPNDALTKFDHYGPNGEIPIVLVPSHNMLFYGLMNIPSGVFVLWQKWNKKMGMHPPGLVVFWPAWNRVSHIVTRASKTYNAPVRNCPTSDNVMVSVDVSITFQIQDPEKFVYGLGANNANALFEAQCDEAIRGLVRGVRAMRVLDLREEFASGMLQGLNTKVRPYGIGILNVKITNVMLPNDLAATLENTTSFQTQMQQQEKAHQANMRVLYDNAEMALTTIRRTNERSVQDLSATMQRALIEREESILSAQTSLDVAVLDTQANFAVLKREATSEKNNAKADGQKTLVEQTENIRAMTEAQMVEVDQLVVTTKLNCAALIEEAKGKATAIEVEAKVEELASKQLKDERKYELEKGRLSTLEQMASTGKFVIAGATGEEILKDISLNRSPATMNQNLINE